MAKEQHKKRAVDVILIALSFFPFFNTLTLLLFGSRTKTKIWTRNAWIALFLNILLLITGISGIILEDVSIARYPYDTEPSVYDYIDRKTYDNSSYEEIKKLPGYYDYQDAMDKWKRSDEYTSVVERNRRFESLMTGLFYASLVSVVIVNFVFFFYVISQSHAYFEKMNAEKKNAVYQRLQIDDQNVPLPQPAPNPAAERPVPQPTPQITNAPPIPDAPALDVNTASEEDFAALPGLTIIDAKRAAAYRAEHGKFANTDEFFTAISAKPHIIVRLQNRVICSAPSAEAESRGRRAIDL